MNRPDQVVWVDGAQEAIKMLNDKGFYVFVVTNQAGVARGYYPESNVVDLHRWMANELALSGAHIDEFLYCPYHPQAVVPEYARISYNRKPAPGMIVDLLGRWPIMKSECFLIGDKIIDIETADIMGMKGYLFEGGKLDAFVNTCLKS